MQQRDFLSIDGHFHIHLSVNDDANVCYIFVNNIYNKRLTMRYFTNMEDALKFIENF